MSGDTPASKPCGVRAAEGFGILATAAGPRWPELDPARISFTHLWDSPLAQVFGSVHAGLTACRLTREEAAEKGLLARDRDGQPDPADAEELRKWWVWNVATITDEIRSFTSPQ